MKYNIKIKPFGLSESEINVLENEHGRHFTKKLKKKNIFLHQHQKLNDEKLAVLEKIIYTSLPSQYQNFLKEHNGGKLDAPVLPTGKVINFFFGFYNNPNLDMSIEWHLNMFKNRYPKTMLPIASAGDGDLILLGIEGKYDCKIYYWEHQREKENTIFDFYKNIFFIADDLDAFFHLLQRKSET